MTDKFTVTLTLRELEALQNESISLYGRLKRDKHVTKEELDLYVKLSLKLTDAKIKATS